MSDASPLTFTQGFMLGQISFLAIILLFMRYVVFSPADKGDEQGWKRRRQEREQKAQAASKAPPTPAPGPAHVLAKAAYEMASHGAESTDWINVLFAQVMQGYRNDMLAGGGEEGAKLRVEKWLNPEGGRTSWLDPIEVTSMSLGTAYPLFSNARIRPADAQGRIRAEIDVDYNDAISLALSTSVLINFPRPRFAVLPVSLGVELVSIGGTLSVQIHDPEEGRQHLHACLLPDFHLNLKTTTLLGSRAKLQDVPKLEQLILSRIRSAIQDRIVHPKHFSLSLPQLLSPRAASTTSASSGSTSTVINGVPLESKSTVTTAPATGVSSPTQAQFTAQQMIDDLGEEAVEAMSQAVKEGFGRMVHDLGLDGLGGGGADGERTNGSAGANGARLQNGSAGVHPASANAQAQSAAAAASTRGRRIPMPAGFPYSRASSTVELTPLPTPGLNIPGGLSMSGSGSGAGSGAGVSRMLSSVHPPSLAASHRSSLVNGSGTAGSMTAYRPLPSTAAGSSNEEDRFRFRGQFAGPASGAGHDGTANGTEPRRMGVLNSRA